MLNCNTTKLNFIVSMKKLPDYILQFRVDYAILQTGYTDELRDTKKTLEYTLAKLVYV